MADSNPDPPFSGLDPEAPAGPTLPGRLMAVCRAFDEAWRNGGRPPIEEVLQRTRPNDRTTLLGHLIRIEVRHRVRKGETPRPEDYVARFPSDRDTIAGIDWTTLTPPPAPADSADAKTVLALPPRRGQVARFELTERLGAGGFGEVWRAFDPHLQREVALKLGHFVSAEEGEADLMLHEARSAGRLRHPAIVPVHEAGIEGDTAYIVSDYIPGTTLEKKIKSAPLHPREAAELAKTLAGAVAYAHGRGIIHRDIKPANVLIDTAGAPHLCDFGVARRIAGDQTISRMGQALGTPAYMSPEQARGDTTEVDPRTDVYSLGIVLYEMLAGRRAYPGDAREALLAVLAGPPEPLRSHRPDVPPDLEKIIEVATARDRSDRYGSANDLAADLGRYLRGEPVLARPPGRLERLGRRLRRPAVAATLAMATLSAVTIPIIPKFLTLRPTAEAVTEPDGPSSDPDFEWLGRNPAKADAAGLQKVVIETFPKTKEAKVWAFAVDPLTGWVLPEERIDPDPEKDSQIEFALKPGEYEVVADLGDNRFANVRRRVPFPDESIAHWSGDLGWNREGDHVRIIVEIPPPPPLDEMVLFPGTADYRTLEEPGRPSRRLSIPPLWVMKKEFTVADYEAAMVQVPLPRRNLLPAGNHAAPLAHIEAVEALDKRGLRLPTEFEWESFARSGTVDWSAIKAEVGAAKDFGPAGFPVNDRIGPSGGVFGLLTNVAELTSSRGPLPWDRHPPVDWEWLAKHRIVRGGDPRVHAGTSVLPASDPHLNDGWSKRWNVDRFKYAKTPGVGFRGVRNVRPPFEPADFVRDLGPVRSKDGAIAEKSPGDD